MIEIKISNLAEVQKALSIYPKQAKKAASKALDTTALAIKKDVQEGMRKAFKNPRSYTINSVKHRITQKGNMLAMVYIAKPKQMQQSYLVPQVEGGGRPLKAFERDVGLGELRPDSGAKSMRDEGRYGLKVKEIKQMLAALGKNSDREFVIINHRPDKYGVIRDKHLPVGIYQRYADGKKRWSRLGIYGGRLIQRGAKSRKYGPRVISSAILARGLRPVFVNSGKPQTFTPTLDFYGIAKSTFAKKFEQQFWKNLNDYHCCLRNKLGK